jgi:hypothetical protein
LHLFSFFDAHDSQVWSFDGVSEFLHFLFTGLEVYFLFKKKNTGAGRSSVVRLVVNMHKALGSILRPNQTKQNKKPHLSEFRLLNHIVAV